MALTPFTGTETMKLFYKIASGILIFFAVAFALLAVVIGHTSACEPAPVTTSTADTMKAIVYRCYGSPDVLSLEDVEKPTPADDEVLVKIHSAAVNPLDWHYMRGSPYIMRLMSGIGAPDDTSLGVDYSGTVVEIGKDVTKFKIGDEVFGGRTGAFGEYVTARVTRAIAIKPPNVSFEVAAGVPIAGVTALQALRDIGKLEAGQKVLINGASGGVGTYAVQIAKSMGAEVTGVCSTRNVDMVRSIGADHVFDYKNESYIESGEQYDLIIDNVGNHSLMANRKVLKPDGTLVIIGGPKGNWLGPMVGPLSSLVLSPFVSQNFESFVATLAQDDMVILADLMAAGKMTSVIDSQFSLEDVPDAIRHSEDGHARGKIIIDLQQ